MELMEPQNFTVSLFINIINIYISPNTFKLWLSGANLLISRRKNELQRANKDKKENNDERTEKIVQRMSSDVSGKQQKYTPIGAREYVQLIYEELLFENIVAACTKHFEKRIESDMVCDILAGERGPSCSKFSQIPHQKVFYVRFIKVT